MYFPASVSSSRKGIIILGARFKCDKNRKNLAESVTIIVVST